MALEFALPDNDEGDGKYIIVNIIARRAREINKQRSTSMYDENLPDPLDVAAQEYKDSLLKWEFRHHLVGTGDDFRSIN